METMSQNGPVCKIKKHALEALLSPKLGDNGVMSGSGAGNNGKDKNVSYRKNLNKNHLYPPIL